jgi:acetyl esterase/lipase
MDDAASATGLLNFLGYIAVMAGSRMSPLRWLLVLLFGGSLLACTGLCVAGFGITALLARIRQQALNAPPDVVGEYDVPYGSAGEQPLVLDIARPRNDGGPHPVVICIHGGGWRGGDKISFRPLIHLLAQRGFVAVSVGYRFAPAHRFPAQLEDVKSAVRYVRANYQRLNADPDRIGAMGGSAGGHLALLLGTTEPGDGLEGQGNDEHSSAVSAVASLVGPTDLTADFPPNVQTMLRDLIGGNDREALRRASPIAHLSPDDPPVLLVYGDADPLVPYAQATAMLTACREAKVEVELITIQRGGHGSGGNPQDWVQANNRIIEFFERQLRDHDQHPPHSD